MKRVAYLLRVREGKEGEYTKAHQNVWPEMIRLLKEAGFENYTIFKRGLDLFVYAQVEDFERSIGNLMRSPAYERWAAAMAPLMEPHPDTRPGERFPVLEEVFHLD